MQKEQDTGKQGHVFQEYHRNGVLMTIAKLQNKS